MSGEATALRGVKGIRAALLSSVARFYTGKPMDGLLTLLTAASLFLPFYFADAALFLFCVYILCSPARRAVLMRFPRYPLILLLCLIAEVASAVYGNFLGMATAPAVALMLTALIYIAQIMDKWLHEMIVEIACAGSLFAFLVAVIQFIWMRHINIYYRPDSVFSNANYYAAVIEFVCLLCAYRLFRSRKNAPYYAAVLVLNLVGLVLSGCRTAWPALGAGVIAMLFVSGRRKIAVSAATLCAALIGAAFAVPAIFPRMLSLVSGLFIRQSIWWASLSNIVTHPLFGEGPLSFTNIYHQYGVKFEWHSHDMYLELLLSYGLVGAVLAGLVLVRFYKENIRLARAEKNALFLALLTALTVSIAFHGVTDCTVYWFQTGALAGMLLAYPKEKAGMPDPGGEKRPKT